MSKQGLSHADEAYWLALYYAPGIGPVRFAELVQYFGGPRQVFSAGWSAWQAAGLRSKVTEYLCNPAWDKVEQDLEWLEQPGHHLLTLANPDYPAHLREIHDPPPVLFVQGDVSLLNGPQLAMVGSRNPSRSGEDTAQSFARHLSLVGLTITSGLAFGIDAASHRGALNGSGKTIAVAGTGLAHVYPRQHQELAERIRGVGALVSELPPHTPAQARQFPRRNRIISGLSLGTLVVEATLRSGSLITARQAAEQGREVFAIPGSIHNPLVKGCHALIKEGVKLVETADDIIEELSGFQPFAPSSVPAFKSRSSTKSAELGEDYSQLLAQMSVEEPYSIDELVERSGLTPEAVSSMLLILELSGQVSSQAGGRYARLTLREPL